MLNQLDFPEKFRKLPKFTPGDANDAHCSSLPNTPSALMRTIYERQQKLSVYFFILLTSSSPANRHSLNVCLFVSCGWLFRRTVGLVGSGPFAENTNSCWQNGRSWRCYWSQWLWWSWRSAEDAESTSISSIDRWQYLLWVEF